MGNAAVVKPSEGEALAGEVIGKPPVPVVITKEHVNAVSRSITGSTAFADGDVLLGVAADPESQRVFGRRRGPA